MLEKFSLKALRVNAGMTVKEAAKELEIHEQTLISWEKGKTYPTVADIPKIEKLYGVTYDHIEFFLQNNYD